MNARILFPRGDYTGNLVWRKAELLGKEAALEQSLHRLEQLGYRASAYPEGDGVSFNDTTGSKSEQQMLEEFCGAFPWLAIARSSAGNQNNDLAELETEAGDVATINCLVIVPIEKVHLEQSFELGPYRFVCEQHFDEEPESRLSEWRGAYLQFEAPLKYSGLLRLNQRIDDNTAIILECLARAEQAMDVIRLAFCSFERPEFTPNPAGQLASGFFRVEILPLERTHLKPFDLSSLSRPLSVSNNWLGLEFDDQDFPQRPYLEEVLHGRADDLALNVKSALRSCRNAFYSLGDESKFLTLVFALDGLLEPDPKWRGWKQRTFVAALVAHGEVKKFRAVLLRYQALYVDVRNPLVHGGKDFYELPHDPALCCQDVYDYITAIIDLIAKRQLTTVAELHTLATTWLSTQPLLACYAEEIDRVGQTIPSW